MDSIPLGGNVTYKPGVKLVKMQDSTKIFVVEKKHTLREVEDRDIIDKLYGGGWQFYLLDIIPDAFITNYVMGKPVKSVSDYDVSIQLNSYKTVDDLIV